MFSLSFEETLQAILLGLAGIFVIMIIYLIFVAATRNRHKRKLDKKRHQAHLDLIRRIEAEERRKRG